MNLYESIKSNLKESVKVGPIYRIGQDEYITSYNDIRLDDVGITLEDIELFKRVDTSKEAPDKINYLLTAYMRWDGDSGTATPVTYNISDREYEDEITPALNGVFDEELDFQIYDAVDEAIKNLTLNISQSGKLNEAARVYDDEKDYSSVLGEVFNCIADFVNEDFKNNNKDYLVYGIGNPDRDRVDRSKVFNGISRQLSDEGFFVSKDRVQHAHGIGNNNGYEIFRGTECIGFLNINSGIYGGEVYVYLENLKGNRIGGSWELRPASEWNLKNNLVVLFKESEQVNESEDEEEKPAEAIGYKIYVTCQVAPGEYQSSLYDTIYEDNSDRAADIVAELKARGLGASYEIIWDKEDDPDYDKYVDETNWAAEEEADAIERMERRYGKGLDEAVTNTGEELPGVECYRVDLDIRKGDYNYNDYISFQTVGEFKSWNDAIKFAEEQAKKIGKHLEKLPEDEWYEYTIREVTDSENSEWEDCGVVSIEGQVAPGTPEKYN